jgi:molybdate transport repressor ModE-like protein
MTLGQLNAFVLVARLGSVTGAAKALGVSEPAVSQALAALRQYHGDRLLTRTAGGMTLTPGGSRLLPIASQMVALAAEADAAVRQASGAAERLQVAVTSEIAEFVANPLLAAFCRRSGNAVDASAGLAHTAEMPVLVANRLADVSLGPQLTGDPGQELDSVPIFQGSLVVVGSPRCRHQGSPAHWSWLVDPAGVDPGSDTSRLLRRLRVPDSGLQVFPEPDRLLVCRRERGRGLGGPGASGRAPVTAARPDRRADQRDPDAGALVCDDAAHRTPLRSGELATAIPLHAGRDARDARSGHRRAAVPVPAARLRHHLELTGPASTRPVYFIGGRSLRCALPPRES